VNQWLDDVKNGVEGAVWPAEFGAFVFHYPPEDAPPWTPEDGLAAVMTLVGQLTLSEGSHTAAFNAREQLNDNDKFLDLYSLQPIKQSPVLEEGTYPPAPSASAVDVNKKSNPLLRRAAPALMRLDEELAATEGLRKIWRGVDSIVADIGSNNWVLGPSMTANDTAFLSNDPHLSLSQPSVWYLAHLDAKTNGSGEIHTAGVTFPGLPYVIIGQNEDIAWGATNTGLDFTDIYVEELATDEGGDVIMDDDGKPLGVMHIGEVVEFIREEVTLNFPGGPMEAETREMVFVEHHGAVRSIDVDAKIATTLRWTGSDVTSDANFLTKMATATTVQEGRTALEDVTSIGQNWVLVDNQGNFGWFPYNRLPKRTWAENLDMDDPSEPFPWLPLDGRCETPETCYDWEEYFEYSELPQAYNRENGYIATANSDLTGANFDGNPTNNGHAPLQSWVADGYRQARIVELIDSTNTHSRGTMESLISDVQSKIGREMWPKIFDEIVDQPQTSLTTDAELIVAVLQDWEFECPTGIVGNDPVMSPDADAEEVSESSGCTAWHEAIREIEKGIVRDLPAPGLPNFVTYFSIMDISRLAAGDVYWDDPDTGAVETKYEVIADALDAAAKNLIAEYNEGTGVWPWGRKHGFVLTSALAGLDPGTFNVYNNPPGDGSVNFWANRGGLSTVDVASPNSEGRHSSGPSTRFQCEATIPVACTIQLPGGQSGHRGNDNYEDLVQLWLARTPLELEFDINEAKANAAVTVDYRQ